MRFSSTTEEKIHFTCSRRAGGDVSGTPEYNPPSRPPPTRDHLRERESYGDGMGTGRGQRG